MTPEEAQYAAETHLQLSRALRENARLKAAEARNLPAWGEMQGRLEAASARAEAAEARVAELEAEREHVRAQAIEHRAEMLGKQRTTAERLLAAETRVAELETLIAAGGAR